MKTKSLLGLLMLLLASSRQASVLTIKSPSPDPKKISWELFHQEMI